MYIHVSYIETWWSYLECVYAFISYLGFLRMAGHSARGVYSAAKNTLDSLCRS